MSQNLADLVVKLSSATPEIRRIIARLSAKVAAEPSTVVPPVQPAAVTPQPVQALPATVTPGTDLTANTPYTPPAVPAKVPATTPAAVNPQTVSTPVATPPSPAGQLTDRALAVGKTLPVVGPLAQAGDLIRR